MTTTRDLPDDVADAGGGDSAHEVSGSPDAAPATIADVAAARARKVRRVRLPGQRAIIASLCRGRRRRERPAGHCFGFSSWKT